jgi:hypothetical protein
MDFAMFRRTPKLPKPPITPTSTMIVAVDMTRSGRDLPTYSPGMKRTGFGRA